MLDGNKEANSRMKLDDESCNKKRPCVIIKSVMTKEQDLIMCL